MKKLNLILALLVVTIASAQTTWSVDPVHSKIRFSVEHMVISQVEGEFKTYEGIIQTKSNDFSDAKINISIDLNSVDTDNTKRDSDLKSSNFFDTAKYPKMTFVSTSIKAIEKGKYILKGNLTLHGVTKEITLNMNYGGTIKDPWGNTRAGLKVTGKINRTDFGLKYNSVIESGGLVVGDDVEITCKVELIKK